MVSGSRAIAPHLDLEKPRSRSFHHLVPHRDAQLDTEALQLSLNLLVPWKMGGAN